MAVTHASSAIRRTHPIFDATLLVIATVAVILAMLAAILALALAVMPAGGRAGIGWMSLRQEVVQVLAPPAAPHRP